MDLQQVINLPQNNPEIPNFCALPALQAAVHRIKTFPVSNEDFVATWCTTMVKEAFSGGNYAITPERRIFLQDTNSWHKPDLVVEKVYNNNLLIPKVYFEFKKEKSDRFEDALSVMSNYLGTETEDYCFQEKNAPGSVFVVVMRGLEIGFFEYLLYHDEFDSEDIPHFRYTIPLTQGVTFKEWGSLDPILRKIPADVKPLYHDTNNLRKDTDNRRDAAKLLTPCVFHVEKHQKEINFFFHHMATNDSRC